MRPPHFHAERTGEWEVRVFFMMAESEMIEVKRARKKPSAKVLRGLCAKAAEHREALLVEFEQKVFTGAPGGES